MAAALWVAAVPVTSRAAARDRAARWRERMGRVLRGGGRGPAGRAGERPVTRKGLIDNGSIGTGSYTPPRP
nr:hypothetical protein KPHV_74330 [Kitasatospora purpeofusca]